MAKRIKIHPENPHRDKIFEISDDLRDQAVALLPTDSQYALICDYKNKKGMDRIRKIRQMGKKDHLTVMCHSLEHVSTFAHLNDDNFKLIKRLIPGPYAFILPATRQVPRLLTHPKKRTVGIRVPDYPICLDLIRELGRPVLAITAKLDGVEHGHPDDGDRELFLSRFEKIVDVIIDNQEPLRAEETTVVDLTNQPSELIRKGLGMGRLEEALALENRELTVPESV
ncbi:L-threonylcarbamoyladenylate synthase [Rhodohalobacter sulfatireducens]|uniref:Threonylcarbamoyl-AMP synthase n=1 Tax=Rhodohalobacter sulfatireducens TaxID=2911366 RepID=A0ABS9KDU4_9BACT|nr:L-threonylcarbamoyladenylate synthase [Rhodohalobacter sulfatireducens]MCG2588982.1 threonylcarbamoyl-AMP synthase [Rhodohalobacter sulfatireducens]